MPQKRKKKKEKNPFSMEFLDSREKRKKERKKEKRLVHTYAEVDNLSDKNN